MLLDDIILFRSTDLLESRSFFLKLDDLFQCKGVPFLSINVRASHDLAMVKLLLDRT